MKVIGWIKSKQDIIFAVVVTILFMCVILVVQDIKNTAKELKSIRETGTLIEILRETEEYADFMGEVNSSLRKQNEKLSLGIDEAGSMLYQQQALIERLIEYLKSINEWPPKISPPKPINPKDLAKNRSEA